MLGFEIKPLPRFLFRKLKSGQLIQVANIISWINNIPQISCFKEEKKVISLIFQAEKGHYVYIYIYNFFSIVQVKQVIQDIRMNMSAKYKEVFVPCL